MGMAPKILLGDVHFKICHLDLPSHSVHRHTLKVMERRKGEAMSWVLHPEVPRHVAEWIQAARVQIVPLPLSQSVNHFTFLCLSFLIRKMRIVILIQGDCCAWLT